MRAFFWNREFEDISDMESQMYTPPERVREFLENNTKKPFIMCEYMHAMGNSWEAWTGIWRWNMNILPIRGGFIWDMIDQAVARQGKTGRNIRHTAVILETVPQTGSSAETEFCIRIVPYLQRLLR